MTEQLYSPLSIIASSGLMVSSLTYGDIESPALVMFIRDPLLSAGPVHIVVTSSPSFTNWLSVEVQVSVRGVPAEREPLRLAEIITDDGGRTGEEKRSLNLHQSNHTIMLTLNHDIVTGAAIKIRDTY